MFLCYFHINPRYKANILINLFFPLFSYLPELLILALRAWHILPVDISGTFVFFRLTHAFLEFINSWLSRSSSSIVCTDQARQASLFNLSKSMWRRELLADGLAFASAVCKPGFVHHSWGKGGLFFSLQVDSCLLEWLRKTSVACRGVGGAGKGGRIDKRIDKHH